MFPDNTLIWRAYPSIIDGIRDPFALDRGVWRGVLSLIVLEGANGSRAYAVQVRCDIYSAYEEFIYSIADHGRARPYDNRGVYIREAEKSRAIDTLAQLHPAKRGARQFSFVGSDFCYETIGFHEPVVRAFSSREEAYSWAPDRC